jgi:gluconate 2-dehydrogenase gamma chain
MDDMADDSGPIVSNGSCGDQTDRVGERGRTDTSLPSEEVGGVSEPPGEQGFSRRELLKRAGILGAAAALPVSILSPAAAQERAPLPRGTLTAGESETLEAIVARLIPTDENGPGAAEAHAARYIERALAGPLGSARAAYSSGLAAVNRYSQASKGAAFAKLPPKEQDGVLNDMEKNIATGFTPDSSAFFNLLRTHTIEGTFSDPYYGGNANFAGWDLIGYPGVRVVVTAEEQRMGANLAPTHKSAYDYGMFSKKGV